MKTLGTFKDIHKGETIIVCGCGLSLSQLRNPKQHITVGVNDMSRCFPPDYLVVVDPQRNFSPHRFQYVKGSGAKYLFSQYDQGPIKPELVRFRLGRRGGTDFSNPNVLHYSLNSPYVALCLAVHMGARRIGLIGVDFTPHHFWGKTGRHNLTSHLPRVDSHFRRLNDALLKMGVQVINLSKESRITAFRKGVL